MNFDVGNVQWVNCLPSKLTAKLCAQFSTNQLGLDPQMRPWHELHINSFDGSPQGFWQINRCILTHQNRTAATALWTASSHGRFFSFPHIKKRNNKKTNSVWGIRSAQLPNQPLIKMAIFWVVAPCSLVEITNVSEVLAASIVRAMSLLWFIIIPVTVSELV
jgi:hypothetical protein